MLTANVQSFALIQVENFDVIALNETWLDTQKKHLLAEVAIHGYKVFHLDTERNKWYILTHLCESGYCLQINPNYQVN